MVLFDAYGAGACVRCRTHTGVAVARASAAGHLVLQAAVGLWVALIERLKRFGVCAVPHLSLPCLLKA